ncbi:MAG: asparaginase [Ruminococcus sp.]|nr:asparaginase [Ruminococcus sp.]
MKIKVILTGGTVGSNNQNGIIRNSPKNNVVDFWLEKNPCDIEFVSVMPYSILSENLTLENWQMLINELQKDYSAFDGIIITHGSDTLSYTSAMVAVYCKDFSIPVVLTGSDKVLSDKKANGLPNFGKAVELIRKNQIGVWTVFNEVYPSDSVCEADCFTDRFSLGSCTPIDFKPERNVALKKRVLIIKEYPFADYDILTLTEDIKAVLLVGYHSGTANEKSVAKLAEKCKTNGVLLYLQGLKRKSGIYSSTDKIIKSGVKPLFDVTAEYAFAYLTFLINL